MSNAAHYFPQKRIKKVIIPYLIWSFVYVLFSSYKTPLMIPVLYFKSILKASSAAIMYYIFVYVEFTLLIPFIDRLAHSRYKYVGFLISPLEIIFMRLMPLFLGISFPSIIITLRTISCLGWFTYYYLGYLLGNKLLVPSFSTRKYLILLIISIPIQMAEGYLYYLAGDINCGTQLKLSSLFTGVLFCMLAYRFIDYKCSHSFALLKRFGDYSFGIYFSHLAIMAVLNKIPYYTTYICFPLNALIACFISLLFVQAANRFLGKFAKYFAL